MPRTPNTPQSEPAPPSAFQITILTALQSKPVYQGTVPAHVKSRRRAAGKVARQSRQQNRGR